MCLFIDILLLKHLNKEKINISIYLITLSTEVSEKSVESMDLYQWYNGLKIYFILLSLDGCKNLKLKNKISCFFFRSVTLFLAGR